MVGQLTQDDLYDKTIQTIGAVAKLPVVRVDRESFLRKEFAGSSHLEAIVEHGPHVVFTVEALEKKATAIVRRSTVKTSAVSFVTGMPANPALMLPAGAADVASYFGFAINMAQQIAFLFGEDEIFDGGNDQLSEDAKIRIVAYLGVMFGAGGAAALVNQVSKKAGANLGKKVASQALTKTVWYPVVKKVGAIIGQKITKKTVEKTITKAVPVLGGVVSGGITFVTFRPMGHRLSDTFARGLRGELGAFDEADLNPDFLASLAPTNTASPV
ncbi:hypothetical protein GCM10027039_38330 [Terrabacter koreensis]